MKKCVTLQSRVTLLRKVTRRSRVVIGLALVLLTLASCGTTSALQGAAAASTTSADTDYVAALAIMANAQ
jgi:hypothetical protein